MKKIIEVSGMSCGHCVTHVTTALKEVPGVMDVDVSLEKGTATVEVEPSVRDETLTSAIVAVGYTPGSVRNA
mgnify:CR=1 FL=1